MGCKEVVLRLQMDLGKGQELLVEASGPADLSQVKAQIGCLRLAPQACLNRVSCWVLGVSKIASIGLTSFLYF